MRARIGIEVRKNASLSDYAATRDGIKVNLSDGYSGTFDKILVAVGRQPNVDGVGLREAGVAVNEEGFVQVSRISGDQRGGRLCGWGHEAGSR